jgi:anti-anti-sigma factor
MEITVTERPDGATIAIAGELDLAEVESLEDRLRELERRQPELLVIDLSAVTFIDSTSLRVLIDADKRAREEHRRLVLVPGPPPIHDVFRVTLLDRRFDWCEQQTVC